MLSYIHESLDKVHPVIIDLPEQPIYIVHLAEKVAKPSMIFRYCSLLR